MPYMPHIQHIYMHICPIYALPDLVMEDGQKMLLKYHTIPSRAFKVKAHTNVESKSLKLLDIYIYIDTHTLYMYILVACSFFQGTE